MTPLPNPYPSMVHTATGFLPQLSPVVYFILAVAIVLGLIAVSRDLMPRRGARGLAPAGMRPDYAPQVQGPAMPRYSMQARGAAPKVPGLDSRQRVGALRAYGQARGLSHPGVETNGWSQQQKRLGATFARPDGEARFRRAVSQMRVVKVHKR